MELSKRERVLLALSGRDVDRVPVSLWQHFPGLDRRGDDIARAHIEFQQKYDFDLLKFTPSAGYYAEDWGFPVSGGYDGYGVSRADGTPFGSQRDWRELVYIPPDRGFLGENLKGLSAVASHFGPEVPVVQTLFSPAAQAHKLCGGKLADEIRRAPEEVQGGLRVIARTTLEFALANLQAGAAGIFFAVQSASQDVMSWDEYRRFGRPFDLAVLNAVREKAALLILHIHGERTYFRELLDYPVDAFNWHDRRVGPSLREAFSLTQKGLVGGINDQGSVNAGTPEDAYGEARDAALQTGGRRLVIGPGCVIRTDAPPDNIRAVRRASSPGRV